MTEVGKHLKKYWKVIIVIVLIVGVLEASTMSPSQWWERLSEANVTYDGRVTQSSNVYCSPDGSLLLDLRRQNDTMYIYDPKAREVGVTNASNFRMLFGYAYSKEASPPIASMAKIEVQPDLFIAQNVIEFTSINKTRVRVTW